MTDTTGTEVAESELADSMGAEGAGGDIAAALAVPDPQPVYAALAACPIMVLPGDINVVGAAASVDALTRNHHVRGSGALGNTSGAERPLIPLDLDRPEHTAYRKLLDPPFVAKVVAPLEADVRALADELIGTFIERGHADIYDEFCALLPSTIFLRLMGIRTTDLTYFLDFKNDLLREYPRETVEASEARVEGAADRC